jgi:hypothetical protein
MRHGWAGTSLLQMWRPLDGVGTERRSAGLNVYIAAGWPAAIHAASWPTA